MDYSTGRVLRSTPSKAGSKDTQQFAHFTTYPMALSPHFARVFCRLLFVMWAHLGERAPFRVVEMGAGSGQLSHDIQNCVRHNEIGIAPPLWRRWVSAFEYLIVERSPALAERQRSRGLRVVEGDAQSSASCPSVLAALTESDACAGPAARDAPECTVSDHGTREAGASVVLSNELLDAFAPVKLRFSLYGAASITDCSSWQEVRIVHTIPVQEFKLILAGIGHNGASIDRIVNGLRDWTNATFCAMANSTIGQEARDNVRSDVSCLGLVFGLWELTNHLDLGVPAASHNMRLRIRKDAVLAARLRQLVALLDDQLGSSVVIPRENYRQIRQQLRNTPEEVQFLSAVRTRLMPVSISEKRCNELTWWFSTHEARISRLAGSYRALGYPALHIVVRPGEKNFIDLVDCLLGPTGGFKLSLDYGASFEGLAHSLSIDPRNDGIFVPPIPQELMENLPECHNDWTVCAGRIDWTTFVDFTNLAAAGELHGWRTLLYGPQNLLEHVSRLNMTLYGNSYSVPGYWVGRWAGAGKHVRGWYGREIDLKDGEIESGVQRWTSFKALLLEKPAEREATRPILFPSWHLDTQHIDSCWRIDPTTVPLSDWIPRQRQPTAQKALATLTNDINEKLGIEYARSYEESQFAARLVDWLIATGGCSSLSPSALTRLLQNGGLWDAFQKRLVRAWGEIWGKVAVARVARGIVQRLANPDDAPAHDEPPSCIGQQSYEALCKEPGGAGVMLSGSRT